MSGYKHAECDFCEAEIGFSEATPIMCGNCEDDFTTATAKIEALESKLATAERSNEWLRQCLSEIRTYALDGGHWAIGNACDDALATGAGSLESLEPKDGEL